MPADPKAQIERINAVSAMARTSWIALLGYLAFIGVTLLGVEDADFFVPTRQTQLPLVNIAIPTASFFYFAPILAAALYVYLQIALLKLWDAIADLDQPAHDDQPIGDALNPWLANDWALSVRGGPFLPARPLRLLGNLATILLVWAAAPFVLAGFWWRSMPAHDPVMTLILAASFLTSLAAGLTGWRTAHAWLACHRPPADDRLPRWTLRTLLASARRHAAIWALAALLAYLSLLRTAWPTADHPPLARADISGVEMVDLPPGWRDWGAARTAFRETWCQREGLDMSVCGKPPDSDPSITLPEQTVHDRHAWCHDHGIDPAASCDAAFAAIDARFDADWRNERKSAVADLPRLHLAYRGLQAPTATLAGADLFRARLEGADLLWAGLEGADLGGARLEGADLRWATLSICIVPAAAK